MKYSRKQFLKALGIGGLVVAGGGFAGLKLHKYIVEHPKMKKLDKKVVMLGFDGMDFRLAQKWLASGDLPNLKKLAAMGGAKPLMPTNPAESPVSWAAYETGCNPGKTGIYDFLNRDPETYYPYLAGVKNIPGKFLFNAIPYKKPALLNLRGGKAIWNYTSDSRVLAKYLRAPGAFPPDEIPGNRLLAGFGTPDIRGTQGTYSYYVDDLDYAMAKSNTAARGQDTEFGGKVIEVDKNRDGSIDTYITGPRNPLTGGREEVNINDFHIDVFKDTGTVVLKIQGKEYPVKVGEWSDWIDCVFEFNLLIKSRGLFRAYLIGLEPHFELYFTPIDFHPLNPIVPISYPGWYSEDLADEYGFWKTQGWGYETWGLNEEILTEEQFWEDVVFVMKWEAEATYGELAKDDWNLFQFVYQNTDRVQHMAWHLLEEEGGRHPAYRPEIAAQWGSMILDSYKQADDIVGKVMDIIGDSATLIVNSDHGFHAFRRAMNINTWLVNNGFMGLIGQNEDKNLEDLFGQGEFWQNIDWSKTRAYALGLGQIYINLDGREKQGIVADGTEREKVMDAIIRGMQNLRDEEFSGPDYPPIYGVYKGREIYSGPPETMDIGPDLVVGFNDGYRTSWQTALGGVPRNIFDDNNRKWSGDHCSLDPNITKGIVFSTDPIRKDVPEIIDIMPSALLKLGIEPDEDVDGEDIF